MKKSIIAACLLVSAAGVQAQGTVADYERAYGLYEKTKPDHVYHWAHDVAWADSTDVFHYRISTAEGMRWVVGHAASGDLQTYASEAEMRASLPHAQADGRQRRPRPSSPFRRHERHWMETDDEQEQRVVTSPDGRLEAWIEEGNVVLHEKGTPYDRKRLITQDGTLGRYYASSLMWSPDSRKLFTCLRNKVERRYVYYVESSPTDQLQPLLHKQEYAKPGDELPQRQPVIITLSETTDSSASAAPGLLSRLRASIVKADPLRIENQYWLSSFFWTADSREVMMDYNQRGHKLYRLLAMDASKGSLRTVAEERSDKFVNYSRLWRHFLADGRRMLWTSERDNWNHLYLYDLTTGKVVRQITRGPWVVRAVQHVDEQNGVVFFSASGMNEGEDPYFVHYYRVGLDGRNLVCLTPDAGNHTVVFSPDRRYLIDTYSSVDRAPVTCLRSAIDGSLVKPLETADFTPLKAAGWTAPEPFVAKGRDGQTDMWGIICRPTNFDATKKYPVIEYIYAGPGDAYTPKSFQPYFWNLSSLAELGFIVVQLDAMGTSYRGKRFEEVCYKNLQDAGFPDRMAWIRAAAEHYPYIDSTRVGIFGASAGGQEAAAAVLQHGDFYKAAYSACGCHDNRMDKIWWNEQWMGWPVDSSYVRASNVWMAPRLSRPLMLVVGELDDNVDPASTLQLAAALQRAGRDFDLVVLPGAHHTLGDQFGEHKRFDFFVRHLLGVNPPRWDEIKR